MTDVTAVVRRLQEAEQQRRTLVEALGARPQPRPVPRVDWRLLEHHARRRAAEWRDVLLGNRSEAQPVLKALLVEPLKFTPFREAGAATGSPARRP